MSILLPIPDIDPDLDRLRTDGPTDPPTEGPTPNPSGEPTPNPTPEPTREPTLEPTPGPTLYPTPNPSTFPTPNPSPEPTPVPTTSDPTQGPTQGPTPAPSPSPIKPEETEYQEYTPPTAPLIVPITTKPPTPIDLSHLSSSADQTNYSEESRDEAATAPEVKTFFSCTPPPSKLVEGRDSNGKDVIIELPPPISKVTVEYGFQVQLFDDEEDIEDVLPVIDKKLGKSLGRYMKTNTNNGQDETQCKGFDVEDFRRRRLHTFFQREQRQRRDQGGREQEQAEESTKIINISTSKDLAVAEDRDCIPRNENCYVVHGEYEATYVGYNEAGVKSSISRVIKSKMDVVSSNSDDYQLNFVGAQDEHVATATTPSAINVLDTLAEVVPETTSRITPYGIGIMAVFAATFLVLCYVVFVKSDATEKVKDKMDERKEKKASKKRALGEKDNHKNDQMDQSYCYDLESVAMERTNSDGEGEAGVEIRSVSSMSKTMGSAVTHGSSNTKRISNRAEDINYANAQRLGSLVESDSDDYDQSSAYHPASGPKTVSAFDAGCSLRSSTPYSHAQSSSYPQSKNVQYQNVLFSKSSSSSSSMANNELALIDRTPSMVTSTSTRGPLDDSPTTTNSPLTQQLPSISETNLPPPLNDTPHMSYRNVRNQYRPEATMYEESEV